MNVNIIAITRPTIDDLSPGEFIAYCARISNPSNQSNKLTAPKLLNYLITHKHFSPFEMVNVVMDIETTRDIARQILRHRSFSFQEFCVEENTIIHCGSKKVKIKNLYKRQQSKQYRKMSDWKVKVYNSYKNEFELSTIKEVFKTGKKPVYKLTLEDTDKYIIATKEHKLYTQNGFKCINDISIEHDFIGLNGILPYQDKEWLYKTKQFCIQNGTGLSGIAEIAGVKYVTIRKWLKRNNLQFTKKEVASYTKAWNLGLNSELQPMFGKNHSINTISKMKISAKKGKNNNLYTGNIQSWRKTVAYTCKQHHKELLEKQNYKCALTGEEITIKNSDIDHIKPVYSHPWLAFNKDNLQVLSRKTHKIKTKEETLISKKVARFKKIKSIEYIGERETYDLEVNYYEHNYIANGIITHNSQRYADPTQMGFVTREARLQDTKNRQNSIDVNSSSLNEEHKEDLKAVWEGIQKEIIGLTAKRYKWAIDSGIAKEQARAILPEGLIISRLYMNGTLRSWLHYCHLRMANGTQKEHQEIAEKCWRLITEQFPELSDIILKE